MNHPSNPHSRTCSATRKVPGGKLVRLDVEAGKTLERVRITGDFFLFPEEALDEVEAALCGLPLPLDAALAEQVISRALESSRAELIGLNPRELVITLQEALA